MPLELMLTGILHGLILAIVAYGVMVPFRLLNFPDLTAEGAFPLGGALCACTLTAGIPPLCAILIAMVTAGIMGITTSLVHLRLKVNTLLAGIILSTMAYSVNLKIMGKPNIALFDTLSIFVQQDAYISSSINANFPTNSNISIYINILILLGIIASSVLPIVFFLRTEVGLRLRAVGLNPEFARRNGIPVAKYTVFGLFLAGCYTGLAGGLIVQLQRYMDIGMGGGIVIHALAALMIGESVTGNHTLNRQLAAPLLGALIYQQIQGLALAIGLAPTDLKFFTGAIVLVVIALKRL